MLKEHGYASSAIAILGIVAFLSFLFVSSGQTIPSSNSRITEQIKPEEDKSRPDLPSVVYASEQRMSEKDIRRSIKYDKYRILNPEITSDEIETSFADWITSDSALPTDDSAVIVIGTVTEANALLSKNKQSVFSQFDIDVERIFKDLGKTAGKRVSAERDGGVVIYPTGFRTLYQISGQRMPIVGKRYLFFLTQRFPLQGEQNQDLYILTGYELKGGTAFPLDAANGGTHPTATVYKGAKEDDLISDLLKNLDSN